MAVLRMSVREPRVRVWLILHRPRLAQITATGGGPNVTWTWEGADVSSAFAGTSTAYGTANFTMARSFPTWEEMLQMIAECGTFEWIQARYRNRR